MRYLVEEPSLVLQSSGIVPMVHGYQRFDIVGFQAGDQVFVVVDTWKPIELAQNYQFWLGEQTSLVDIVDMAVW